MKISQRSIASSILRDCPEEKREELMARMGWLASANKPTMTRGKRNQQPEQLLQEAVCRYLDTQPRILYWANNPQVITGKMTGAKMGYLAKMKKRGFKKGVPDICMLVNGKFCLLELKSEKGVVSDEQKNFLSEATRHGVSWAIIRSVDEVIQFLN